MMGAVTSTTRRSTPRPIRSQGDGVNRSLIPDTAELNAEVARRVAGLVRESGDALGPIARFAFEREGHVLSQTPTTAWPLSVVSACTAAAGDWRRAVWPAAAVECAIVAADLFDDVADGEADEFAARFGRGELVTAAAGLLALAGDAVLRATEDGVDAALAVKLGRALGSDLALAASGQISGLRGGESPVEPVITAYQLAAGKSGPLGALAFGLGALAAGASESAVALYRTFGWHLAVRSQLFNDARDVMPDGPSRKRDVVDGVVTVPLVFTNCQGAPKGLNPEALAEWEAEERRRVVDEGGIVVAELLANAERLRAEEALDRLAGIGHDVSALRSLVTVKSS